MVIQVGNQTVHGEGLDNQTRCRHWHSEVDIIAVKLKCCGIYYACNDCHQSLEQHAIKVWPKEDWDEKVVLCGACGNELTIKQYLGCENSCPYCRASFNPGCRNHYHLYFESP